MTVFLGLQDFPPSNELVRNLTVFLLEHVAHKYSYRFWWVGALIKTGPTLGYYSPCLVPYTSTLRLSHLSFSVGWKRIYRATTGLDSLCRSTPWFSPTLWNSYGKQWKTKNIFFWNTQSRICWGIIVGRSDIILSFFSRRKFGKFSDVSSLACHHFWIPNFFQNQSVSSSRTSNSL